MRRPIVPVCDLPQPVTVLWSGSADVLEVAYIHCLSGRVPKAYEIWALVEDGVREFHPCARVKLLDDFREDTFHTHFFNARRLKIPFLVCRTLNMSVEFLDVLRVTQHVGSCVGYTPIIFFHS